MLNWIVRNRTIWVNWMAWNRNVFDTWSVYLCWTELFENRTVYLYKNGFGIK